MAAVFDSSSVYATTADFSTLNIVGCIIWLLYAIWFIWMAVSVMTTVLTDLGIWKSFIECSDSQKKNGDNTLSEANLSNVVAVNSNQKEAPQTLDSNVPKISDHRIGGNKERKPSQPWRCTIFCLFCCPCCVKCVDNKFIHDSVELYSKYLNWFKSHFGEDTKNWFVLLWIRELIEIFFQIFAVYNYNGLNLFNTNQVVLPYKEYEVKVFSILLGSNCVLIGSLWLFYVFCHSCCRCQSFKKLIFFVDTTFDTFYALFPIIIVINQNGFNLKLAVLKTANMFVLDCYFSI